MKSLRFSEFTKLLNKFYEKVQTEIEKFNGRIVCERGCSFCCEFTECYALPVEAASVALFLNENSDSNLKAELSKKIENFRINYRKYIAKGSFNVDPQFFGILSSRIRAMRIPCPFLTDKNDCLIYTVRPLTCRTYISYSQEDCEGELIPAVMQEEKFLRWLTQVNSELGTINKMFLLKANVYEGNVIHRSLLPLMLRLQQDEFVTGIDEFNIFKIKK
ncbi:MAG: YkgJ family cysteine cluster protein [Thermoplasmata archaeon]